MGPISFKLLVFVLIIAGLATGPQVGQKCADRTISHKTCDKAKRKCTANNACGYLPKARGAHKWWCCPSNHRSKTCPHGLKPRNQQCLTKKVVRKDGKKLKALFCREDEMCYKTWRDAIRGYGVCCKAYVCDNGSEPSGECGQQCTGKCHKFKKYKKGILVPGKYVHKCCGGDAEEEPEEEGGEEFPSPEA